MYNIQNRNITSEEKTFIYYEHKININNNLEESIKNNYIINNIYDIFEEDEIFISCEDSKIQFISSYNLKKLLNKYLNYFFKKYFNI